MLLSEEKISKKLNEKVKESFELCVRVLISTLFLIIFLLFTSLDTSGTWNVSRPAIKTSTRDTYSALLFGCEYCYYIVPVQAPLSSNQV